MRALPLHHSATWDTREVATPSLPMFDAVAPRWRASLPTLTGPLCTLRELTKADARSLFTHLTTEEVARFISPPPTSVEGFEAFIDWTHQERRQGRYVCYGVVPHGRTEAVGLFQVAISETPATGEWGFALGSAFWGSGLFVTGARRMLRFAFTELGLHRLEARAMVANLRGHAALRKCGAVREGLLRASFERCGERFDQFLWVITRHAWRTGLGRRRVSSPTDTRLDRPTWSAPFTQNRNSAGPGEVPGQGAFEGERSPS